MANPRRTPVSRSNHRKGITVRRSYQVRAGRVCGSPLGSEPPSRSHERGSLCGTTTIGGGESHSHDSWRGTPDRGRATFDLSSTAAAGCPPIPEGSSCTSSTLLQLPADWFCSPPVAARTILRSVRRSRHPPHRRRVRRRGRPVARRGSVRASRPSRPGRILGHLSGRAGGAAAARR